MSMYGEPSIADLLPAYYCNNNYMLPRREQNCPSACSRILTHLIAVVITVGLCLGGYYYYETKYLPRHKGTFSINEDGRPSQNRADNPNAKFQAPEPADASNPQIVKENINEIDELKKEMAASMSRWRLKMSSDFTNIQSELQVQIHNALAEAFEIYEADGIGLMDYAASYAGAIIVGISKETFPYPTHRPLSLFRFINVDVLSSPEEVIRPCVLPGSCFAFRGDNGAVRIRLGKPVIIGGVTLSHASRLLLGPEGMTSAPKEFVVHGYPNEGDQTGTFLGQFEYDQNGRQHQTFAIHRNMSKNQVFKEVTLTIINNYGKEDFTCIYRFRVHNTDDESSGNDTKTAKKKRSCC